MEVLLMQQQDIKRVLIDEDDAEIVDGQTIHCCSIGDVIRVLEIQRTENDSHDIFNKIRSSNYLFLRKTTDGQIFVSDLDEEGLENSLFEDSSPNTDVTLWGLGVDRIRTPFENLSLISFRWTDSQWQTNLLDQYIAA